MADDRYKKLPEQIRPEDMITSAESKSFPAEKDEYWREVEWMLRTTGAGGA